MMQLFFIAAVVTIILGIVALFCLICGIVLWFFERTRFLAPFITFIPTLAALGAAGGAWGLGYLGVKIAPMYMLPLWAWIFGLPIGGVLGGLIGLLITLLSRQLTRQAKLGRMANLRSDG